MSFQSYRDIAAVAQKRRAANIPTDYLLPDDIVSKLPKNVTTVASTSGHFSHDEIEIIESEAEDILLKIRERIWTAVEVAEAFCKAAAIAQQLTNCLTEILFPEALARAHHLDSYLQANGAPIGPLHGLPISLKDSMIVPPHPASIGIAHYANEPTAPEQETVLVTLLRNLGAVFYVKTNVPVAMMMMETNNNIWGETVNPYNRLLSAGGSSGGEGALIAMRGSPLGIGTDIGGSIRIPSAFCNLYGLKPSFGRFPTWGGRSGIPGNEFILAVNGPMSRSLESLKLYCRSVLSETAAPWRLDAKCLPLPWREGVLHPKGRKLRIGIMGPHDGLVTAHPPYDRALAMTRQALEAAGHEVFEWQPVDHDEIIKNVLAAFFDFGGTPIMELLKLHDEHIFPSLGPYAEAAKVGEGNLGPTQIRMMNLKRNTLQKRYLDRWMATGIIPTAETGRAVGEMDGVIMASSPWCAARKGVTENGFYYGHTAVWSLLDYPACTFPVTFADKHLDKVRSNFMPSSDLDAKIQADYDPNFYHGAPVSLQLIGQRLQEEKVLEMVEVVAELLKRSQT